ncbi:MAG: prealbumin-like fold domain-containing protein, partial [Actinomycetota bacterium]
TQSDTCSAPAGSGNVRTCTLTINNPTSGSFTANVTAIVTMGGTQVTRATDGNSGPGGTGPATKRYVDASVQISANDTNGIGEPHTFNITVTAYPDSATPVVFDSITPSVSPAPGTQSDTCSAPAGSGNVRTCTLTINSNVSGTFTANVSAVVTMGGLSVTRSTSGNAGPGGSGPATKIYVSGSIRWVKHDEQGRLLGGATFQVCRTHNYNSATGLFVDVTDVCVTVADDTDAVVGPGSDQDPAAGRFLLTNLVLGRYTIRETVAPSGYTLDPNTKTVEITTVTPNRDISNDPFIDRPISGGQVAPTAVSCQDYVSGTAPDLNTLQYGRRADGTMGPVSPGVFFYYSRVTAPASSFSINIAQSTTQTVVPLFGIHQAQAVLYSANCSVSSLGTLVISGQNDSQATFAVSGATAGATFIIGVKYSSKSVEGTAIPGGETYHYDFKTLLNGTLVDQDANGLNLVPKP